VTTTKNLVALREIVTSLLKEASDAASASVASSKLN
jgi:hypothetical protein